MPSDWNEEGRFWEEDNTLLEDHELAQCARAFEAGAFESPVPTQMVSNGEYLPAHQTKKQKHVQARIEELAATASKKLGMDRRRFLRTTGGMAASFLAMNEVFGHFYPELTPDAKRKILGLNSARLYGIDANQRFNPVPADYENRMTPELRKIMELPPAAADNIEVMREKYAALGGGPSHRRYGWIRKG